MLRVENVEEARRQLEAAGVELGGETVDSGVCRIADFAEPDGNALPLDRRYAPYADGFYDPAMVPEAPLDRTEAGLVRAGEGWFVLNAREASWRHREGRGESLPFAGRTDFPQVGINLFVLGPGEPIGMYHWEADQEDFLLLSGEGLLLVEGEERPLRQWDFVHCPAGTKHMIVGAGHVPCVVLAIGAREHQGGADWGSYTVDEVALRHGAGVEQETSDAEQAYARFPNPVPTRYRDGWLPG